MSSIPHVQHQNPLRFVQKGIYRVSASFLRQAAVALTPEYITAASTQPTGTIQYGGFIVRLRYCTGDLRNAVVSMCTVWFKTRSPLSIVWFGMTAFSRWKCESAKPTRKRCGTMGQQHTDIPVNCVSYIFQALCLYDSHHTEYFPKRTVL